MWRKRRKSLAADVLEMTDRRDRDASVWDAMALLGYDIDTPVPGDLSVFPPKTRLLMKEMSIDITRAAGFVDGVVDMPNTLTDWPNYKFMMDRHGRKVKRGGTALMIGSLTAMSSRAFVCLAEQEYGTDTNCIIDLASTKPKAQHGHFMQASGLNLPFRSASVDVVHTNRLLHVLEDPSSPSGELESLMPKLFQEIARILVPRGQVLMYELTPGVKDAETYDEGLSLTQSFTSNVLGYFNDLDYDIARVGPGTLLQNTDYLFNASRDGETALNAATFSVYASKL